MPRPEVNWRNPNLARSALITLLVLAGASLIAKFVSNDEPTLTNSSDNTALITPLPTEESSGSNQLPDIYSKEIINGDIYWCGILGVTHPNSFRVWYGLYSQGIMADKPESFMVKRPAQEFVERFWGEEANTMEPVDSVSCMPLTSFTE